MSGRRKVRVADSERWVFNRMAGVYDARPSYPAALVDALGELAGAQGARVIDLGAGIGHLALPLAARGFEVTAVEPARSMLTRLGETAAARGLTVRALHAAAEALPVEAASQDLALVADALHFLDAALSGREIARVLAPRGALALVRCELGATPYMRELVRLMEDAAPRRPRATAQATRQVFALAGVEHTEEREFQDETAVDPETLERILRSISFIGPAMNGERFARFLARVRELPGPARWARRFVLCFGRTSRT
jgi:ubiquinone/menaquinone biosynthesis C-methylase UbiE